MDAISVSAERRQKLAGLMHKDIAEIRDILNAAERDVRAFDDDSEVIFALNTGALTEVCARLTYRVGEANGGMLLPDLVNGQLATTRQEPPKRQKGKVSDMVTEPKCGCGRRAGLFFRENRWWCYDCAFAEIERLRGELKESKAWFCSSEQILGKVLWQLDKATEHLDADGELVGNGQWRIRIILGCLLAADAAVKEGNVENVANVVSLAGEIERLRAFLATMPHGLGQYEDWKERKGE